MVPPEFANFFIASASAGGALVGLLFVAVSTAPGMAPLKTYQELAEFTQMDLSSLSQVFSFMD